MPQGHVPRAMTVHLYGDMTRQCAAGDTLTISGVFLPVPSSGFRQLKARLAPSASAPAAKPPPPRLSLAAPPSRRPLTDPRD